MRELDTEIEALGRSIVDACFTVHTALGPGLLESAYEVCLAHELSKRGVHGKRQVSQSVTYDGVEIDAGYRLDLLVEDRVVVELKAVERILPIHEAQLITYLKLSGCKLGYLVNFNTCRIKDGIHRRIHTK